MDMNRRCYDAKMREAGPSSRAGVLVGGAAQSNRRRLGRTLCWTVVAAFIVAGNGGIITVAHAEGGDAATCDPQHRVCCEQWAWTSISGTGHRDTEVNDSYQAAVRHMRYHRKIARSECRFFGSADVDDCGARVAGPVCRPRSVGSAATRLLVQRSIAALHQKLSAEIRRSGLTEKAFRELAQAAAPLAALDNPFAADALQLAEYLHSIEDVQRRVEDLRKQLNGLTRGARRQIRMGLLKVWAVGDQGLFGGHTERLRVQNGWDDRFAAIASRLPPKVALRPPPTLTLAAQYRVVAIHAAKGHGRTFVLAGRHVLRRGALLARGTYPLGGMTVTGGRGTRRAVSIERKSGHLIIHIAGGGRVELGTVPDRDGDGVPDSKDACPDKPGRATTRGCPDRDGDGVPDSKDTCVSKPGRPPSGCPARSQAICGGGRWTRCPRRVTARCRRRHWAPTGPHGRYYCCVSDRLAQIGKPCGYYLFLDYPSVTH